MASVKPVATLVLPARILGPSLTAAGLAGWVLSYAERDVEARRTRELQDLVDAGLRLGDHDVEVVRPVVEEAVELWRAAADLTEQWAAEAEVEASAAELGRMTHRLRVRAESLERLLARHPVEPAEPQP
jgi:HAMP domain-containing protein